MIDVGAELDSLELYIQRNIDEQMMNGAEIFLGPAAVSLPTNGVEGSSATALTPTLLGTLAEGIVALGGPEDQ